MKPDISVIMSVYNGEEYLAETIESVINQTFKNWELVAVNDCSSDKTAEILEFYANKEPRIKVINNEVNLKLPASLNKAINNSNGKYIARMDADDICMPDRLQKQFEFMEQNPNTDLSSCRFLTLKNGVYASGGAGGRTDDKAISAMLLVANPILHPGVIAKAEVMKEFCYDTTLTCTEDLELWTRLALGGKKMAILPECLLIYRLHDKQITSTTLNRQHTEVLKIENKYYGENGLEMSEEMQQFYIGGIYFKEKADINNYLTYAKMLRKGFGKNFSKKDLNYALFEILAEYKRHSVPKKDIIKALLTFGPFFLVPEFIRRKRSAKKDIIKCTKAATSLGLKQTGGTKDFPIFGK